MGIEPTSEAWEASILPLYDARSSAIRYQTRRASCKNSMAPFHARFVLRSVAFVCCA